MTRPDVACLCVHLGIHSAITVAGEHRDQLLAQFAADHAGPGHVPEVPPRDWYKREAQIVRLLTGMRPDVGGTT